MNHSAYNATWTRPKIFAPLEIFGSRVLSLLPALYRMLKGLPTCSVAGLVSCSPAGEHILGWQMFLDLTEKCHSYQSVIWPAKLQDVQFFFQPSSAPLVKYPEVKTKAKWSVVLFTGVITVLAFWGIWNAVKLNLINHVKDGYCVDFPESAYSSHQLPAVWDSMGCYTHPSPFTTWQKPCCHLLPVRLPWIEAWYPGSVDCARMKSWSL